MSKAKAPTASPQVQSDSQVPTKAEGRKKPSPEANGGISEKVVSGKKAPAKGKVQAKKGVLKKAPGKKQPTKKAEMAKPIGRPSKFKSEFIPMVEKMATMGLIDAQMCDLIGINVDTFWKWRKLYPALDEANARGKGAPDRQVQQSLFKRAIGGFTVKEVTRDENGLIVKTIEREVPPDTIAALKWLFNRVPKEWREKVDVQVRDVTPRIDTSKLSKDQLDVLALIAVDAMKLEDQESETVEHEES